MAMKSSSLLLRINTAIIITGTVIALVFAAILYPLERKRYENQIERINFLLETIYQQKLNTLANELFARQVRALNASMEEIRAVDGVVGVGIYLENGKLFLFSGKDVPKDLIGNNLREGKSLFVMKKAGRSEKSIGIYKRSIEVIGSKIGYISIVYDFSKFERESQNSVILFIVLLVTTLLLMAALLNLFLFKSIIHPVSVLRDAMKRVEDGQLGETINLKHDDEMGQMGRAFNDMSTKLKKGQQDLMETKEKFRSIFENAIEGIFQCRPGNQEFITANPSTASILGYPSPEAIIESVKKIGNQLFCRHEDWIEFESALENRGAIINFETRLRSRNGTDVWVSISARKVTDIQGKTMYYEGSFIDITEHRQRQKAERERKAAQAANRAKSDFIANMSHEIRTPLNAILGFSDILESSVESRQLLSYIQTIKSSGKNLLQLINDILDLSKIEAGRMEIQLDSVDLKLLLSELQGYFIIQATQKGIDLTVNTGADMPQYLMLDKVRLRQILFNLVGNAVKFTQSGYIKIQADTKKTDNKNTATLTISVEDTGIGIDPKARKLIFESFRQDRRGKLSASEGTGLGLTISKNLAEMMGGSITVQGEPDMGSTFTISIPSVALGVPSVQHTNISSYIYNQIENITFKPATLLIVDDIAVNRQLVLFSLKEFPFTFIETDNGLTAVEKAMEQRPDMILMDIKMPGLDGYGAIERIKTHPKLADIPIIAITAAGMTEDIKKITSAGFNDYLIRPFTRKKLILSLSSYLAHDYPNHMPSLTTTAGSAPDPLIKALNPWQCPENIAGQLYAELKDKWVEIKRKRRIPDIKAFAQTIEHLGDANNLNVLSSYGKQLGEFVTTFDVDKINQTLLQYQQMIENIILTKKGG